MLGPCPPRYGGIPDHLQAVSERFLVPQIVDRAKREHPYEVPSVVAVPIVDGGPDYIGWILEQTEQPA